LQGDPNIKKTRFFAVFKRRPKERPEMKRTETPQGDFMVDPYLDSFLIQNLLNHPTPEVVHVGLIIERDSILKQHKKY
jgi:hypothetical protein